MTYVTIRKHGDLIGVDFPPDLQARLGLEAGQQLTVIEVENGISLVKSDPELELQMDIARRVLREQAGALKALADYDRG